MTRKEALGLGNTAMTVRQARERWEVLTPYNAKWRAWQRYMQKQVRLESLFLQKLHKLRAQNW